MAIRMAFEVQQPWCPPDTTAVFAVEYPALLHQGFDTTICSHTSSTSCAYLTALPVCSCWRTRFFVWLLHPRPPLFVCLLLKNIRCHFKRYIYYTFPFPFVTSPFWSGFVLPHWRRSRRWPGEGAYVWCILSCVDRVCRCLLDHECPPVCPHCWKSHTVVTSRIYDMMGRPSPIEWQRHRKLCSHP